MIECGKIILYTVLYVKNGSIMETQGFLRRVIGMIKRGHFITYLFIRKHWYEM